jgi:hypothetical protein
MEQAREVLKNLNVLKQIYRAGNYHPAVLCSQQGRPVRVTF